MKAITESKYRWAAAALGCEVEVIKAVAVIESGGRSGFLKSGEPVILFEGHVFHRLTGGKYSTAENEDVSYPKWVRKYYKGSQHKRLQKAVKLDRAAALKSASWGVFQIMGFNYKLAGFASLQQFINAMYSSEDKHLEAFVQFIKNTRLDDELRAKDFAGFAYGYNGPRYKENNYDEKLLAEYKKQKAKAA